MAQIHLVICYDTEDNSIGVDWQTTLAKFHEENIYHPEAEKWDYPSDEEDKIIDELIPQLDHLFEEFHLDLQK